MGNVTIDLRQGVDVSSAVLTWLPPDEPNGVITQYQVLYAGYNGTQVKFFFWGPVPVTLRIDTSYLLWAESIPPHSGAMPGISCCVWSC